MNFREEINKFVAEQQAWSEGERVPLNFGIENLDAKTVDQMSDTHLAQKELVIVSHPGWDRLCSSLRESKQGYIYPDKRIGLQQLEFVRRGQYASLLNELLLEDLLDHFSEQDIPIVLTIPSYQTNDLCSEEVYGEHLDKAKAIFSAGGGPADVIGGSPKTRTLARDNQAKTYVTFIDHLIRERRNIYLLPTRSGDGCILGDPAKSLIHNRVESLINTGIHASVNDGKLKLTYEGLDKIEKTGFHVRFDIGAMVHGEMDPETCQRLVDFFGEDFMSQIRAAYVQMYNETLVHNNERNTRDTDIAAYLKNLVCGEWDTIYFAGGRIYGCLGATLNYFAMTENPNIVFLERYSVPQDGSEISVDGENLTQLAESFQHEFAKRRLKEILCNSSSYEAHRAEFNKASAVFKYLNDLLVPSSRPVISINDQWVREIAIDPFEYMQQFAKRIYVPEGIDWNTFEGDYDDARRAQDEARQRDHVRLTQIISDLATSLGKAKFRPRDLDERLGEIAKFYQLFDRETIDKMGIPYEVRFRNLLSAPTLDPVFPILILFEYNRARDLCGDDELKDEKYDFRFRYTNSECHRTPLFQFVGWDEPKLTPVRTYLQEQHDYLRSLDAPYHDQDYLRGIALKHHLIAIDAFLGSWFKAPHDDIS